MEHDPLPEQQTIPFDPIVHCIVFDASGRIRQSSACARSLLKVHAAHFGEGFAAMEVSEEQFGRDIDAKAYVLDGVIMPKTTALDDTEYTIQADGVNRVRFAVPAGTSVLHAGEIVAIEDDVFEFTTDARSDHHFSFIAPAAFHDFKVTIHAV
ncbi:MULTISPECIES: hypothetical protein [unclassified Rhizobium]|uniref:hypothetical protein n=1 Tax=unclassified Rhizobium TaxID=2613769 RepID=UPI00160E3545|nr:MULTISPECIES: hypothetical protein [unclassified Rhizobium]MBB3381810.1 hypothetical protein [Rhizobium sp. BK098]MBB3613512.1 hypothetical protein [Rhizobium sp. BK609]MBB3679170.1 hypothetical protein [Rhizobium sp. BK612]